jgi:hypothetical protein
MIGDFGGLPMKANPTENPYAPAASVTSPFAMPMIAGSGFE